MTLDEFRKLKAEEGRKGRWRNRLDAFRYELLSLRFIDGDPLDELLRFLKKNGVTVSKSWLCEWLARNKAEELALAAKERNAPAEVALGSMLAPAQRNQSESTERFRTSADGNLNFAETAPVPARMESTADVLVIPPRPGEQTLEQGQGLARQLENMSGCPRRTLGRSRYIVPDDRD